MDESSIYQTPITMEPCAKVATRNDCQVCCEPIIGDEICMNCCPDKPVCRECMSKWLLPLALEPRCMHCAKPLVPVQLISSMGDKWVHKTLRDHKKNKLTEELKIPSIEVRFCVQTLKLREKFTEQVQRLSQFKLFLGKISDEDIKRTAECDNYKILAGYYSEIIKENIRDY